MSGHKFKYPHYSTLDDMAKKGYEGVVHDLLHRNKYEISRMQADVLFDSTVEFTAKSVQNKLAKSGKVETPVQDQMKAQWEDPVDLIARLKTKTLALLASKSAYGGHRKFWKNIKENHPEVDIQTSFGDKEDEEMSAIEASYYGTGVACMANFISTKDIAGPKDDWKQQVRNLMDPDDSDDLDSNTDNYDSLEDFHHGITKESKVECGASGKRVADEAELEFAEFRTKLRAKMMAEVPARSASASAPETTTAQSTSTSAMDWVPTTSAASSTASTVQTTQTTPATAAAAAAATLATRRILKPTKPTFTIRPKQAEN